MFKSMGLGLICVLIAGFTGFFIGKSQLPAKVESTITATESKKESVQELKVISIKKKTSTATAPDGSKKELTFDEMNFASDTTSEVKAKSAGESKEITKNNLFGVYYVPNYNIDDRALNHAAFIEYGNFAIFANSDSSFKIKNLGLGIGFHF